MSYLVYSEYRTISGQRLLRQFQTYFSLFTIYVKARIPIFTKVYFTFRQNYDKSIPPNFDGRDENLKQASKAQSSFFNIKHLTFCMLILLVCLRKKLETDSCINHIKLKHYSFSVHTPLMSSLHSHYCIIS